MLKRLIKWLNPYISQPKKRNKLVQPTSIEVQKIIREAKKVQHQLENFTRNMTKATYISLGQNCNSAWYLKELGLKTASYPFDWTFSSPDIIIDCIEDNFSRFLNKSYMVPKDDHNRAGHSYYHANLFNHRSPLKSENDYDYYKRCCNRFMQKINSTDNVVFLMTLINEPNKRIDWAKGFAHNFKMPQNQKASSIDKLKIALTNKNSNSKFIVIEQYTNQKRGISFKTINDDLFYFRFCAAGENTGVKYMDNLDDFCYKLILSGLINLSGKEYAQP